jgi:hypothetical protein
MSKLQLNRWRVRLRPDNARTHISAAFTADNPA